MKTYTTRVNDADLFVKEMGAGPPVVVLHGGPGAHHDYLLPQFGILADAFKLYFYDQRGGGRSKVARPHEVTWRQHVADLEALRGAWGLERMRVVAYSWGGLLGLLYASEHPERLRCLVLVDPAPGWGDYYATFQEEFRRRTESPEVEAMRRALETSGLKERDPEAYRQRRFELSVAGYFRDPSRATGLTPFRVQAQAQQATWASLHGYGPTLRERLTSLDVPTLILHGRHDPIPLAWAQELAAYLPRAELVVLEKSAHVPYVEEPETLFARIRSFLERHADD
ncbi:MAG: alpha/beta fold hydrolase [Gemmatimonadota bacterium]